MAWDWKPGMRCVCINAAFADRDFRFVKNIPLLGSVYTIRDVSSFSSGIGVTLVDIVNSPIRVRRTDGTIFMLEPPFKIDRFRPLSEDRLDQFRVHLAPSPRIKERA